MIEPSWIVALGAILFGIGLLGTFYHKNAIVVLMCIELMLNAANLNFVAAASHYGDVNGWVYTAIAIAIAAAEVAIGLAILLSMYSTQETISLEAANKLRN
ncbi:MAG: NADH-quinone oxidoreductase subunit NuoK [Euryarchaeota archaeon]|jgi:NADH-quinone oxidoreductase subunit K|nr:NADH-quinone oxidoreductase subunit NuoK [Euryarchaeota archaeon]MEC7694836.1 NADH-quinone oxidoreductase subunit NuoK [Candidatus Thermoplasmatota archaeon]|tara:strand:+ start:2312 stop:2614 length:303 start_codon:yes stop_codon:yes gene_type:complete